MRTRIRSVKPDLLAHSGLFRLEQETGLPCRVVFVGLFMVADREGRFAWRPEEIARTLFPDGVDAVDGAMRALVRGGFIVRYRQTTRYGSDDFGFVIKFKLHQQINNRELASILPDPDECEIVPLDQFEPTTENDASSTRQARVEHASGTRDQKLPNVTADLTSSRVDHASDTRQHASQLPSVEGKGKGKGVNPQNLFLPSVEKVKSPPAVELPDFVPADAWADYRDMRKRIRKPMTAAAERLAFGRLAKLRDEGNDPRIVLEQSTFNAWQGLFAIKPEFLAQRGNAAAMSPRDQRFAAGQRLMAACDAAIRGDDEAQPDDPMVIDAQVRHVTH